MLRVMGAIDEILATIRRLPLRDRRRRLRATICVACAVLAIGVFDNRTASACSERPPTPALRGYPSDGAEGVPTDVVPFFSNEGGLWIVEVTLTSAAGDAIAAQVASAQLRIIDVTFEKALQPNTTYALVAKLGRSAGPDEVESLSLSFTTGAGPVSEAPAPPEASLQSYRFSQRLLSNCTLGTEASCVAVTSALPVEESDTDAAGHDSQFVRLRTEPWLIDSKRGPTDCLKLRARAPNATYSSPVVLCGDDAPPFMICGSERIACTSQEITHDGALLPAGAGGSAGFSAGAGCPEQGGEAMATSAAGQVESSAGAMAQAGAQGSPLEVGGGCNLALHGKRSTNSALGALLALAWFARFKRSRARA